RGGLFRWAGANIKSVIEYIKNPTTDIYQINNLVPATPRMVMDTSISIGFHSAMHSRELDSKLEFIQRMEERIEIHKNEKQKMDYLAERFRQRLKNGKCLFVIKLPNNAHASFVNELVKSLKQHNGFSTSYLLAVRVTESPKLHGTIDEPQKDRTINAWVSHFSPLAHADHVAYSEWKSILSKIASLNLFNSTTA
ncbi:MAG: hypothetical protein PHF20_04350, partial [Halothiobacillaceae bacterium]|nr:hypothetical protein [Halothiobacillaceae bacterium]